MHFEMEELVPIVGRLAEEYTSFESTSIPYEKAEQLMEAVLYCIHEAEMPQGTENVYAPEAGKETHGHLPVSEKKLSARQAYQKGKSCVEQKTKQALELYHEILAGFVSCGNHCLHETFTEGLPEFFRWYDVKFNPQNAIITLDYPVLKDISGLTGIDKIYEFLKCICLEQKFLQRFPEEYVVEILEHYAQRVSGSSYTGQELVENICEIVLGTVLPHILLRKPLSDLSFREEEYVKLQEIFSQAELPGLQQLLADAAKAFLQTYDGGSGQENIENEWLEYMLRPVQGAAVRFKNAADYGTLRSLI